MYDVNKNFYRIGDTMNRKQHAILIALFSMLFVLPLMAQEVDKSMWTTDGPVYSLVERDDNENMFIGGSFNYVGPVTGSAVPIGIATGEPMQTYPYVNGIVWTIIDDGIGGWIIGGDFNRVGNFERRNLARIQADGSVHPTWAPQADSTVFSLVISGERVFIGGLFTSVNGVTRNYLAAVNFQTGNLIPANQWNIQANDVVRAMAVSDSELFVVGRFTSIGDTPRNRLASVSVNSSTVNFWDPDSDGQVFSIRITGTRIYVGGNFTKVSDQDRSMIAAFDRSSGDLLPWAPVVHSRFASIRVIRTIDVANGYVYIGGLFESVDEIPRDRLARIPEEMANGTPDTWAPNPDGTVYSLRVHENSVYFVGEFRRVYNQDRYRMASVSTTSNTLLPWSPKANSVIYSMGFRVADGIVYVGGHFTSVGGVIRKNLAELHIENGTPTLWNPSSDQRVEKLVLSGSTLYAIGNFNLISGVLRPGIAALDINTGQANSFAPAPQGSYSDMKMTDAGLLLAGGFNQVNGVSRNFIALVDPETGQLVDWAPNVNSTVSAIDVRDSIVYIGGNFTAVNGESRSRVAGIHLYTGQLTEFNPPEIREGEFLGGWVYALSVTDSLIYIGGRFNEIDGQARYNFGALHRRTGALDNFTVPFTAPSSFEILSVAVTPSSVYLGGLLFRFENTTLRTLIGVDRKTGEVQWNPGVHEGANAVAQYLVTSERTHRIYASTWNILTMFGTRAGFFTSLTNPGDPGLLPPTSPTLLQPNDGEIDIDINTALTWEAVALADWYRIQVSQNGLFEEILTDTIVTGSTSLQLNQLTEGTAYYWRVKKGNDVRQSDWSEPYSFTTTGTTSVDLGNQIPAEFELLQNYPNPFNPSTVIRYGIPVESHVHLEVYDILGQRVAVLVNEYQLPGYYTAHFDAGDLASGMYMYRIQAGDLKAVRRLMLIR
jgi:hypothetical protein